ncbi:MAG: hypothetical protein FJZ95_08120 [Chloroflexi bacterium]|nr:hypothetical protein [Chloroflexota bacterium]
MKRLALVLAIPLLAVVFGFFGVAVSGLDHALAQTDEPSTPSSEPQEGPARVKVGVYVLNVGKLDTSTGSFTIDFYLSLSSDRPVELGKFEFSNGRATSIDKSVDDPTEKFYRIQATLADSLNLSRYPFDHHKLTIEIEDKEQTSRSLVYEVSQADSGLDPAVNVSGWDLDGWEAKVDEHYYAPYDTSFSRYVFSIEIHRSVTAAILKTLLPALTIVAVGLLSLVLSPDKIVPRLTLNTGSLTGAVLFHLNMTSSLPPMGYLTFGDRFMLFNYLGLAMTLVSTLIALYYVDRKRTDEANRVHNLALIIVPLVWVGLQGLNFLFL